MSWTSDVLSGLAAHLAGQGVGAWHPDGTPYAAGVAGIYLNQVPASPDPAITLTAYPVSLARSGLMLGIQVRTRVARSAITPADPDPAQTVADEVYNVLHYAENLTFGPASVPLIWRQSSANLDPDENGRLETTSNYYTHAAHPSAHVSD